MSRHLLKGLALSAFSLAFLIGQHSHAQRSDKSLAPTAVAQFYAANGEDAVWGEDAQFDALLVALEGLAADGLNPEHYHLSTLKALRGDTEARDPLATDAWFSAAAHMIYGKLDPVSVEPDWTAGKREADLAGFLSAALAEGRVATSLSELAPVQPGYGALRAELAALRLAAEEEIVMVPSGATLRLGDKGERVGAIQARLVQLGFLEALDTRTGFDADTASALEIFQLGAGLDSDGIAGPATVRALNRGVNLKLEQVRVNMERWRWLPDDLGHRHVRVNIAGFDVTTYANGSPVRIHHAIVGKTFRKTPVFSDKIEYIVLNPWWETPRSLARADKLPLFKRDPGAVSRLGFQVLDAAGNVMPEGSVNWNDYTAANFPFRLRQAPGPQNALGEVKIIFPNRHNVYLHDTPTRGLFAERQRAFSSGCVRTEHPVDLAKWLLEETAGWDSARVDDVLASKAERRVDLAAPVDVHILYFTAVPDSGAGVRYLDDIYERDGAVLAGLKRGA